MKEAEARLEHGWVTVQGADAVIADGREKNENSDEDSSTVDENGEVNNE